MRRKKQNANYIYNWYSMSILRTITSTKEYIPVLYGLPAETYSRVVQLPVLVVITKASACWASMPRATICSSQ